jgi:hypothetical protein
LKKAQLTIVEIYQENREMRQQLVAKTLEASTSQGREGNVTWLKRQLSEAQYTIIQLCEAQRMSEERNSNHFKEGGLTMENVCATLIMQRQVMNIKRHYLSLRRTLWVSKLQTKPKA